MGSKGAESYAARIKFVSEELYWFAKLTKKQIADHLGVDSRTVQSDLKKYADGEKVIGISRTSGRWEATDKFQPKPLPSASKLLYDIASDRGLTAPPLAPHKRDLSRTTTSAREQIPIDSPPELLRRDIDATCLRAILRVIRENVSDGQRETPERSTFLEIDYWSPAGESRIWICPHALTHDTFRWAVRAYREDRDRFVDLVLDRVTEVYQEKQVDDSYALKDTDWDTWVIIMLAPHPGLTKEARRHIEHQYGMKNGALEVKLRKSQVVYFLKRHQLEEESTRKAPHQQPLVVRNRAEVTGWIPPDMQIPPLPSPGAMNTKPRGRRPARR